MRTGDGQMIEMLKTSKGVDSVRTFKFRGSKLSWLSFGQRTVAAHIHSLGFAGAVAMTIVMATRASDLAWTGALAVLIYGISACLVFGFSALYHYLHDGVGLPDRMTQTMEKLDHAAIYLFVAGSYTAIIELLVEDSWKYWLLGFVWAIAVFGQVYTFCSQHLPRWAQSRAFYTGIFVVMGWSFAFKGAALVEAMSLPQLSWLLLGGGAYTIGAVIYIVKKPNPLPFFGYHEIWHGAVVVGWGLHAILVWDLLTASLAA